MQITKYMKKVPGGMLLIPAVIGLVINTLAPNALKIGGFTQALFKDSTHTLLALFVLCAGAQIDIKKAKIAITKGVVLTVAKVLIGAAVGLLIGKVFGNKGILGLSILAIIPAMTNSNSSLFAALSGEIGDETDTGAVSIIALNNGPLFTMIILGSSGLAKIPYTQFIAVLVPIIVGFVLGNLDPQWRKLLSHGPMLIPFLGFSIGASLSLQNVIEAGIPGFILGLATLAITGLGGYLVYGVFKGNRAIGAAIGTTAGVASATPMAIAAVDPSFAEFAQSATVQVSASCLITAILCPLLVSYLSNLRKKKLTEAESVA